MIEVNIKKPLNGDRYVGINEETLNRAILRGERIKVTVPKGEATIDPKQWIKSGKRVEKYFKKPYPMVLWYNNVPLELEKPEKETAKLF